MIESTRRYPTRIANGLSPGPVRDIAFLDIEHPPRDLFGWLIGKTAYCTTEHSGTFDALLKHLPQKNLLQLQATRETKVGAYRIRLISSRMDCYMVVRRGNKWGTLVNAYRIDPNPQTLMASLDRLFALFRKANIPCGDLRSPGHVAGLICNEHGRYTRNYSWLHRPERLHTQRFYESFRGPRFESTTFGTYNCHDYDITSAYPWAMASLPTTANVKWIDLPDIELAHDSIYGAALCDLEINPELERGPITYRYEEINFSPVGHLQNAWLNLPEILMLLNHPEIGRIKTVHHASWGLTAFSDPYTPFTEIVQRLYKLRVDNPDMAPYIKAVMVAMYGKLQSVYDDEAPPSWNPIMSSAITSTIRCRVYEESLASATFGEWADGIATTKPIKETSGMGGIRLEGSGEMLAVNDYVKESEWKDSKLGGESLITLLSTITSSSVLPVNVSTIVGLGSMCSLNYAPMQLGQNIETKYDIPFGSPTRLAKGRMLAGDLLEGPVATAPPRQEHLPMMAHYASQYDGLRFD